MFLEYKKTNIFYTDTGKGSVVVLIHGFLENATMWSSIIPEISKKNRVITIDLLGHGKSDCLGYVHSMNLFSETVEAVLKHLKIRKCTIIGHSLGGYVALAFVERNPQKIKGICLLNSTSNEDDEARKNLRTRAIEMAHRNYEPLVKMSIANLFQPENVTRFKTEIEIIKKEALKTSLQGYIAAQEGMKIRPNRNIVLLGNNFKKLFVIGEKDPVLNYNSLVDEAKKTTSEFVILNGGHMSYIENSLEIINALKKFLKSI